MKTTFAELDKEIQIGRCTIPQAVFVTLNPDDETFEQVVERQEKFLQLPENIKDKLVASETAEKIKAVGKNYNLELLQMAPIARVIRSYYFGEVKLEDFASIIEKESKISSEDAQEIAKYVIERIINRNVQPAVVAKREKMPIAQAIEKYPEIKRQALTSYPIVAEGKMANPTVENWINDYFSIVGAGNRDVMKRSSYLYHSKNAKSLNMTDRQRLSRVLKSLDDNSLLDIDLDKKEIVFEMISAENKKNEAIIYQKTLPSQNIQKRSFDGFSGADKRDESKVEISQGQETEKAVKMEEIISPDKKEDMTEKKKGKFDFLIGNKKRDEFENSQTSSENIAPKKNKEEMPNRILRPMKNENKKMTIQHVRGNNWDLGSAHFLKESIEATKNENKANILEKSDKVLTPDKNIADSVDDISVKFTFPQQLPVEKENKDIGSTNSKFAEMNGSLGKIKPIE